MMRKNVMMFLMVGLAGALILGCAAQQLGAPPGFSTPDLAADMYDPKVANFMVILDASSSMNEVYNNQNKFDIAKAVANGINQALPELDMSGSLRAFGFSSSITRDKTMLFYGPVAYNTAAFQEGLDKISRAGGTTPMTHAIDAAAVDLADAQGKIAVIVISDGKSTDSSPVASAETLKAQHGDNLCFYTVLVGDDVAGKATMDGVANAGQCGFAIGADEVLSTQGMADFVEKVFLLKKSMVAAQAACPDADGDGVCDDQDKCPGTPKGARVNSSGCWVIGEVLFDFDKSVVKAEFSNLLDEVAGILKANVGMRVLLEGHTDSVGTENYNMGLSKRRAEAVKAYLVGQGVPSDQLATVGYGESKPTASNATSEGRSLNRRTEISPEM